MKNKKESIKKEKLYLIIIVFGIILLNLNLINSDVLTGSTGTYSGQTGSFGTTGTTGSYTSSGSTLSNQNIGTFTGSTGGFGGGVATYGGTTTSSSTGSSTASGSFSGGTYSSFSGTPYNYISGGYGVYGASSNPQFNNPSFFSGANFVSPEVYWPKYTTDMCLNRQDFLVQIAPGGCSPAVVRSDLLEEQPVPVFCQLMSVKINPLIDVSRIRSLTFTGQYPAGISGISYYPARAALTSQQSLISSPINDNLGYVVIILARQQKESDMNQTLSGNLTANVQYDMQGAFGTGNTNFYVNEMSDSDWQNNYKQYGFWNGKGYIRADSITPDQVTLSIYQDVDSRQSTVTLMKGQTSSDIYLNGFYCAAGMNIRVENIGAPVDSALLRINDQQMWVSRGDTIMDGKCTVATLDAYAGGGSITINCPVQNGRIALSLASGKANLSVNGVDGQFNIGDRIDDNQSIYLGYVGQDFKGNSFVVLVKDSYSNTYAEFQDKNVYSAVQTVINTAKKEISDKTLVAAIQNAVKNEYKKKLTGTNAKLIGKDIDVEVVTKDSSALGVSLSEALGPQDKSWDLTQEDQKTSKEYYDWAIKSYQDLITLYPNEKVIGSSQDVSYAEQALFDSAQLSREYGMNQEALKYYDQLMQTYPTSSLATAVSNERDLFLRYGESNSKAMVNVNGNAYFVELTDFREPTRQDANAVLLIDGKETTVGLNEIQTFANKTGGDRSMQITAMNDNSITISYVRGTGFQISNYYGTASANSGMRTQIINLGQQIDLEGVRIKVLSINLKKQAKINIIPKAYGPMAQANFSFAIGIEKRNIQLSTDQTKDLIKTLNDNIKTWSDVNDKLGNVITGLKTACFATAAVLNVKNLLSGWSGESMARKDIMTKSGGWNDYCQKQVGLGKYTSVDKCLLDNNDKVNTDIDIYKNEIEATNKKIQDIENSLNIEKRDILDMNGQVDARKAEDKFAQEFNSFCISQNGQITLPDKDNTTVSFTGDKGICSWNNMTQDQMKNIMTLYNTRQDIAAQGGSDVLKTMINNQLGSETLNAKNYYEQIGSLQQQQDEMKKSKVRQRVTSLNGDKITLGDITTINSGDSSNPVYGNYNIGDNVVLVSIPFKQSFGGREFSADSQVAGKDVEVPLKKQPGNTYTPDSNGKFVLVSGEVLSDAGKKSVLDYMGFTGATKFQESNAKAYQNKMIDRGDLMVKYFEQAPYKGLPAEVPFDVDNGWYVEMEYVLSGVGAPYDASGRVLNFWVCNVGANGLIEYKKSADDICENYVGNSDMPLNFPGMSASDSKTLVMQAQQAITEAAKQYGKKQVIIGKNTFKTGIANGGDSGRCSDFMSPMDCNVMFNVCDPVMCPASRCDLGGNYRVDDVVQTGIFGSLVLCLPNAKEGIAVPICLSGIHAGLEGYISIMNSTVACLNESLTTGQNIGICDEIKSIYLCEFFWKEATPLLNVIVPRVVESFYSQGVRGGGEYMTVQNAWTNMQSSINYFTNSYATTSMQAFQARSTAEIGGSVCQNFMSATYPTQDLLQKLVEPDSPVQYTAWFSEEPFTSATIPSTSDYKVYYHIFAGKDQGAYYTVYLKDLPQSNYIYSSQMYTVDTGYIAIGSQVDQAKDFTAVSGYKQLCISINGQDKCGFGKVTSDYLINSLTDAYAASEASTTNIKSSTECVGGTPSLISAINPNLQAGVDQTINSQLYNNGIIRICATNNPGKQVLPNGQYDTTNSTLDRYQDVGYCDDPTIRCWLDTSSVKSIIQNSQILNQTLQNVTLNNLGAVNFWTEDQSISIASQANSAIQSLTVTPGESSLQIQNDIASTVAMLTDLSNLGFSNAYRARALYLLGSLYKKVAEGLLSQNSFVFTGATTTVGSYGTTSTNTNPNLNINPNQWNGFYDNSNPYNVTLKIYNYSEGVDQIIQIEDFDTSTGKVTMWDGTLQLATLVNGHISLSDWTDNSGTTTGSSSNSGWVDNQLRDNVIIDVMYHSWMGLATNKVSYKFNSGRGWVTVDKDILNLKGYVDGINAIVKKMVSGDSIVIEGNTFTRGSEAASDFSEKIFEQLTLENAPVTSSSTSSTSNTNTPTTNIVPASTGNTISTVFTLKNDPIVGDNQDIYLNGAYTFYYLSKKNTAYEIYYYDAIGDEAYGTDPVGTVINGRVSFSVPDSQLDSDILKLKNYKLDESTMTFVSNL